MCVGILWVNILSRNKNFYVISTVVRLIYFKYFIMQSQLHETAWQNKMEALEEFKGGNRYKLTFKNHKGQQLAESYCHW